ncbi:MAG: right-handed parallel beta-helix repeat-containing protein [Gammaproteobacteria bacterium]|nr:right-handed parallel beta-helix repeat-containing protein [Gammaproteobacteria bacterium]
MARHSFVIFFAWVLLSQMDAAPAAVPAQFIAKMYTEVLGRAPDPRGWNSAVRYFQANGCNRASLTTWGRTVFSSAEFSTLDYDSAATTLILFLSILNREPDPAGFRFWHSALEAAETPRKVALVFLRSPEFVKLVPHICGGGSYSFGPQGTGLAIEIPSSRAGGYGKLSEAELQALLYSTAAGETVYLQQESVVYLRRPLAIPAGVTLATDGLPSPHRHAVMARLIRASPFPGPMVELNADDNPNRSGTLKAIWVDGQRAKASAFVAGAINVEIYGGTGGTLDGNFLANSLGWSTIHSYGSLDGKPCAGNVITNNVVTAYSSVHSGGRWTDGISVGCENTLVQYNQVIDPTDVGIVVYTAYPATQRSLVIYNTVVSAGNSAFAALGFDPLQNRSAGAPDFTGSAISMNSLWSGPNTHFIIGLAIGSRAWYPTGELGYGASAIRNTTAGVRTQFGAGIVVSGMESATVQGNVFLGAPIPASWTGCAIGNVIASVSAGLASGSIQNYSDVELNGCMSDHSPAVQSGVSAQSPEIRAAFGRAMTRGSAVR